MEPLAEIDEAVEAPALPLTTEEVVERYESLVYGIAVAHTGCRSDADDVYQEAFLTYHRRRPELNSEEHRKAWLITTTLNCARSVARSSWRTRVVPLTPDTAEPLDQFRFETAEQQTLFDAVRSLPLSYRTVLYLFYFADQPIATIADALDITEAAAKMRLSRGRGLMRDLMQEGDVDA